MKFIANGIKGVMSHGADGAALQLSSQEAGVEDLTLSIPVSGIPQVIIALSTAMEASYRGKSDSGRQDLLQAFPLASFAVATGPEQGMISIALQVQGGGHIRIPIPPDLARQMAALLMQEAATLDPGGVH